MPKVITHKNSTIECCICLDKKSIINELIIAPCNPSHSICKKCIKTIIISMPISGADPEITCQYPFSDCDYVYPRQMIKEVLRDKYLLYKTASLQYFHEDFFIRKCITCNGNLLIPELEIGYMGDNIFLCDICEKEFCIDCNSEISSEEPNCILCEDFNIYTNPLGPNYYFYKQENKNTIIDYFLKNQEITPTLAAKQICEKIKEEGDVYVNCPVCSITLKKSEQCNGIKHCHVEICYSCGMFSEIGKPLRDHWSAFGDRGCPRWDSDNLWKIEVPDYICLDNQCHSQEQGDCIIQEHQQGLLSMQEFRKKQHVYHQLKSLLPLTRYKTMLLLPDNLKKYVPEMKTLEYLDSHSSSINIRKHYMLKI